MPGTSQTTPGAELKVQGKAPNQSFFSDRNLAEHFAPMGF